jgi:hypothetical protein
LESEKTVPFLFDEKTDFIFFLRISTLDESPGLCQWFCCKRLPDM